MADDNDPLAGAEDSILTPAEIEAAKAVARKRWTAEAKKKATDELISREMLAMAREEGQRTGQLDMDELVFITIDLPEFAPALTVNMEPFWHGHTYQRPRHVVNSLREMMVRAWNHQDDIDGRSIAQKLGARRIADRGYFGKGPSSDPRFTFSAGQGAAA